MKLVISGASGQLGRRAAELALAAAAAEDVILTTRTPEALASFAERGAAVRRVELASTKYLDPHDRSGYLGQLELKADAAGGARVQTVGAGTPAAAAGLMPGDRLVEAGGAKGLKPVNDADDLAAVLDASRPGKRLSLVVDRDVSAQHRHQGRADGRARSVAVVERLRQGRQ